MNSPAEQTTSIPTSNNKPTTTATITATATTLTTLPTPKRIKPVRPTTPKICCPCCGAEIQRQLLKDYFIELICLGKQLNKRLRELRKRGKAVI